MLATHSLTIQINGNVLYHDVNLRIHRGEVWGILGSNGSGKTTFLHTLAGLYPAQNNHILLESHPLSHYSIRERAQKIGLLFQDTHVYFPQTVWEYCLAGRYPHQPYFNPARSQDQHIVQHALQCMELQSLAQRNILTLSGGEKRRLAMATLLAQTPHIYLLDEPTNHLDIRHQFHILQCVRQLAQSAAVMMTLHDINHAQHYCTHLLLLYPNGAVQQGTTANILTMENLSRLYQHPMSFFTHNNVIYWKLDHSHS